MATPELAGRLYHLLLLSGRPLAFFFAFMLHLLPLPLHALTVRS